MMDGRRFRRPETWLIMPAAPGPGQRSGARPNISPVHRNWRLVMSGVAMSIMHGKTSTTLRDEIHIQPGHASALWDFRIQPVRLPRPQGTERLELQVRFPAQQGRHFFSPALSSAFRHQGTSFPVNASFSPSMAGGPSTPFLHLPVP